VVLSVDEVRATLGELSGTYWLIASLLYGSGLRLTECLRMRVKDLDVPARQIVVRSGKGNKDRTTVLPDSVLPALAAHLERKFEQHRIDCQRGFGEVYLPHALHRKYPNASHEPGWQFVFPASRDVFVPELKRNVRWHLHEKAVQRAVRGAVKRAGIMKPAS